MMHAKRGQGRPSPEAARVSGWVRAAATAIVAALGLALSACGGAAAGSSAAAAQGSAPPQGTIPDSSAPASTSPSAGATAAQSTSAGGETAGKSGSGAAGSTAPASKTTVTINWVPPTENTNGSWLTNLAGYHIHYGTAAHKYTKTIAVANPGLARYVVASLTAGKYYFAVAAVNAAGTESPLSAEVTATVN